MEQLILSLMPLDLTCRYRYHNHDNENQVPKIDSRKVQQSQQFTLPAQALKLLLLGLLEQHIRTRLYVSQSAFRIRLSTVSFQDSTVVLWIIKELSIKCSFLYGRADFLEAVKILVDRKVNSAVMTRFSRSFWWSTLSKPRSSQVDLSPLVSHIFKPEQAQEAFQLHIKGQDEKSEPVWKVILEM